MSGVCRITPRPPCVQKKSSLILVIGRNLSPEVGNVQLLDLNMEFGALLSPSRRAVHLGAVCGPPPLNENRH